MELIPGAEPFTADGGPHGALVLHGFTGNPSSVRDLGEAFAAAGFAVELPRLPGHGTSVEDMLTTSWADWSGEAEAAYQRLAGRVDQVVVAGLSMGGSLTAWIATKHPGIAGLVFINALVEPLPEMRDLAAQMVDAGDALMDGLGSDIADPDVVETAYEATPLVPLISLLDAVEGFQESLATVTAPALIMHSPQDHAVPPSNADHLANLLSGPVERLTLERSYHVATLDYDADLINEAAVTFARKVTT